MKQRYVGRVARPWLTGLAALALLAGCGDVTQPNASAPTSQTGGNPGAAASPTAAATPATGNSQPATGGSNVIPEVQGETKSTASGLKYIDSVVGTGAQ
ncbi:MAG TPA: hypothetical protein VGE07_21860, partial [Herpetosiphonaceae bacterium]